MSAFLLALPRACGRFFLLLLGLPLLMALVLLPSGTASAATAPISQCNGILNTGGQAVRCSVSVANTLDVATGVGSSSVTVQVCVGAAGAPICAAPVTTSFPDVVSSISQCDSAGSGGGGEITCTVDVTNDVTAGATPTAATVNQCVGSAGGGGTMTCNPLASTSGATVTQCNGSGNGGGTAVTCTVASASTQTASLPLTVDQCNGSANGGGSLVTCSTSITNRVTAAALPTPTPTASAAATPTPSAATTPTATPTSSATGAPAPIPAPSATSTPQTTSVPTAGGGAPGTGTGAGQPVAPVEGPMAPVDTTTATTTTATTTTATTTTATTTTATTSLPRTGADTGLASLLAALSIAVGGALLVVARQPRGRHAAR